MYEIPCDTIGCKEEAVGTIKIGPSTYSFCHKCHEAKRDLITAHGHAQVDFDAEWMKKALAPLDE